MEPFRSPVRQWRPGRSAMAPVRQWQSGASSVETMPSSDGGKVSRMSHPPRSDANLWSHFDRPFGNGARAVQQWRPFGNGNQALRRWRPCLRRTVERYRECHIRPDLMLIYGAISIARSAMAPGPFSNGARSAMAIRRFVGGDHAFVGRWKGIANVTSAPI